MYAMDRLTWQRVSFESIATGSAGVINRTASSGSLRLNLWAACPGFYVNGVIFVLPRL